MNEDTNNRKNITKIYLLNVPIEKDYKHTLYFDTPSNQQSYFQSKIVDTITSNFSYQRKDNIIRIPRQIDRIYNVNYVMYQNTAYSNKWFYAFVSDMRYMSDGRTDLYIETDVIQTWLFDYQIKTSFIEREHTNNDTVGYNTIPEDLETGEFICNAHIIDDQMDDITNDLTYILSSSVDMYANLVNNKYPMATGQTYNGIFSGTKYFRFDSASVLQGAIQNLADKGQIEAVNGVFMAPKVLAKRKETGTQTLFEIEERTGSTNYTNAINKQNTLNGYTPRNKKLLTHLFNYMVVSNNSGNAYEYHYEDFSDNACNFIIKMAITPGCSIRMTPKNYKGMTEADEYSINMGKLPICSFPCDMYTNWLTQNSINVLGMTITRDDINVGTSALNGIASAVSIASGNPAGAVSGANSVLDIGNALITKKQHELIPPQARGNLNSGDVITSSNKNNFHFYKMSIRQEYASIIDSYFDLFGYKTNKVKLPNTNHRENYWYIKTIDINLTGNLPQNDLIKIKNIYNSGITWWKNPANIKDYSVSNNII